MKTIGNDYWVHGPLIFGSAALAARFARDFEQVRPIFAALHKEESKKLVPPRVVTLLGEKALLLPSGTPTGWMPMANGGVFVRPHVKLGRRKAESFEVPEVLAKPLQVGDGWVLFDSVSEAPDTHPRLIKLRARRVLPVGLAPGTYGVEHSTPAQHSTIDYEAVRLLREGSEESEVSPRGKTLRSSGRSTSRP